MSKVRIEVVDRREFLIVSGGAAAALMAGFVGGAHAKIDPADENAFLQQITKGATPTEGKVKLEMPEIAENGATVPLKVSAESPMTADDYCKSITIISTKNPAAHVCTFHFTPDSGKAWASIRIRMAETQEVWAVAEMSDGSFYIGKTTVKVTIGGCGG